MTILSLRMPCARNNTYLIERIVLTLHVVFPSAFKSPSIILSYSFLPPRQRVSYHPNRVAIQFEFLNDRRRSSESSEWSAELKKPKHRGKTVTVNFM